MESNMRRTTVHPHQIFTGLLMPAPPPTLDYLPPLSTAPSNPIHWTESSEDERRISYWLQRMQSAFRSIHKRTVLWPSEGNVYPTPPGKYLVALLQPIADLYNELHSDAVLIETPMKCVEIDFDDVYAVTFITSEEERQKWCINLPVVIAIGDDILDASGNVTSRTADALSLALGGLSTLEVIIVTNFREIVVFFPSWLGHAGNSFARVLTATPALALQAICAASISSIGLFINQPNPDGTPNTDENFILPMGPPQDPHQALLPDKEVFQIYQRFSDFDKATLVRDPARALQFFRWHSHVRSNNRKLVVSPGDTVNAKVVPLTEIIGDLRPIYPFDWSDLPPETAMHLRAIQRPCPIDKAGLADVFQASKCLQLTITEVIAEGSDHGFATVYQCQLMSIDGKPVSMSTPLCLKLFDDRFLKLDYPGGDGGDFDDEPLHRWLDAVVPAEDMAVNEVSAYEKLRPVQGTVVPWCYGVCEFTLPDQHKLPGIIMEYIPGKTLGSKLTGALNSEQQISMIKSCRYAVRMLDLADINQNDWHVDQIMLYINPDTQINHCIFIDFALTKMTWSIREPVMVANYSGCRRALVTSASFEEGLIRDYFGIPDEWDPTILLTSINGEDFTLKAKDSFTYISFKFIQSYLRSNYPSLLPRLP